MRRKERPRSAAQINVLDELIVDNFAGGGGASTGIELALGRPVDIAINHDPASIQMHKRNHPYTTHYCENVWDVNPLKVTQGRPVALCWLSPDCTHFSKAKGGKPREKKIRGLAWVAVKWAATVHPRVIILENVEEFQTWGPLDENGYPVKSQQGRTFRSFVNALKRQGYHVEWKELRACDYGAPTIRKRFFLIARCDGKPISWPEPTHGPAGSGLNPYRTAAECIDWSIMGQSIFERKKPLAENTLRRIAKGTDKYVIKNPEPFIVQTTYSSDRLENDQKPGSLGPLGVDTPIIKALGHTSMTNCSTEITEPLRTIVSKAEHCLATPPLTPYIMTNNHHHTGGSMDEPLPTVTTGNHHYLMSPHLIQYHSETSEKVHRGQKINEPLLTIDASNRYGLATAFISKYFSGGYQGAGASIENPLPTITAVDHNSLAGVSLSVMRHNMAGKSIEEPNNIITTTNHFHVQKPFLTEYYGTGQALSVDAPLHTITTKDRNALIKVEIIRIPHAESQNMKHWPKVRELLNRFCGYELKEDELLILHLNDEIYYISDITLRMLMPRELYNAQGFPPDYVIDFDVDGKRYSKAAQVARCGNSVPPPFAEALVRANLPELCGKAYSTMEALHEDIAI